MKTPKILFLDVENSPSLGYYYDLWREGNIVGTEKPWYMLSIAYQWAGSKTVHCLGLVDYPQYKKNREDDSALLKDIHTLLDEADIVIAHNADKFDIRKINARLLKHGLNPPSPYKTVDTLKVAKRYFKLDSNRLDDLGKYLKIGAKLPHTGFKLWKDCMDGDLKAWELMKRYNKQDVVLLEKVYTALRPWIVNHPRTGEVDSCNNCGGSLQARGFNISKTGKRQRLACTECGSWTQGPNIKEL